MKTILVNAYHYPPEEGSCSDKNVRIVKKLVDSGYNVIVLTKAYKGFSNDEIHNNQIRIIRTKSNGVFHKVYSLEQSHKCTSNINIGIKGRLKSLISSNLCPDSVIDWVAQVKKTYKQYYNVFKDADLILSISSPYSAHIASRFLSEKLKVPYIMCYGDPWIYEPKRKRGRVRYAYEKQMEQRLIDHASKILLITDWNKKKYQELYSVSPNKIYTYHIGYDESNCISGITPSNDGVLKIIYGGSLDKVHRNPQPFIEAMSHINGVKAYIYNSDNPDVSRLIEKYNVHDKVILFPIIGTSAFYQKLYEMDALLLFGNKTPFQVPGKVFTYISTRKGILYVKNNNEADDGTESVLNAYGNSITIKNNVNDIIDCLEKMKTNLVSGVSTNEKQFEYHYTMQPIVDAIDDVLKG